MFDHVTLRVSDREATEGFYRRVLGVLGVEPTTSDLDGLEWDDFSFLRAEADATARLHVGFAAASRALVDAFWRAGVEAGFRDDGPPGPRPEYGPDYYGGFLLDPDGNSAEAVHHDALRTGGVIDHVWLRVRDLEASTAFYEAVAPLAGFSRSGGETGRTQFRGTSGSFSLLEGTPTENVHIAFPARDRRQVDAFHEALLAAGHRDNGGPGERLLYHPGYYAAFVLDPDGNNIELVHHGD